MSNKISEVNANLRKQIQNNLAQTLLDIKTIPQANEFLKDFLTEEEYATLVIRLAVGYWLKKKRSEENIKDNLKVNTQTIKKIETMITNSGFSKAIKNLEAEEWANKWSEKIRESLPSRKIQLGQRA